MKNAKQNKTRRGSKSEKCEVRSEKGVPDSSFSLQNSNFLFPRLRFPEFRGAEGWEQKTIGEVCKSFSGGTPSTTQKDYYGGSIPFIRSAEIDCTETELFLTDVGLKNSAAKLVARGDVLIALYGANSGDVALGKIEGAINQAILCLKSESSNAFIYQFLSHRQSWIISTYLQGGQGNLSGDIVKSISLGFPTPAEQQKIAECLSSVDELIAAQARKLDALQTHKKGLMQGLFPQKTGSEKGEVRSEKGERDSSFSLPTSNFSPLLPRLRFPEFKNAGEWVEEKLEDLAKRGSGHTPNKAKEEYYNGGIKWVSLADSKRLDNGLISETAIVISEQGIKNSSAVLHPAGSVILSRDAGVGKSAVMSESMAVSQHFIVWTCDKRRLSNWFLYYILQIKKPVFENVASGSTIKTIGLPFFKELRINVPSVPEQQRIATCLSSLDDLITAETQKHEALKSHKKGLMQGLFPQETGSEK
jgi:type I restriction enzyme S subunit